MVDFLENRQRNETLIDSKETGGEDRNENFEKLLKNIESMCSEVRFSKKSTTY